jgi:hypothetical protein
MMTSGTGSQSGGAAAPKTALAQNPAARRADGSSGQAPADSTGKSVGYGLPCAKCRLYYPANLDICPTCHHNERVSPVVPQRPPRPAEMKTERPPDTSALEREREEFLKQFKSQLVQAHSEVVNAPEAFCKLREQHTKECASAEVCAACYERLQERLDVFEAALHIDLKDAAQIIYDAVWADPSDPNKTYQNAASALLAELRKRAGLTSVLGPFQPLAH